MEAATETYDFVVVGGGSAGAVVAARLSEQANQTVLLIEAGPRDDNRWIDVPMGFGKVLVNPELIWNFESEPEANLAGRRISALRGKVLGGGSSVNGMIYVRGMPSDYALWRQMGVAGWSYDDVLPYYRKAERQERGADDYHGADGPLSVEDCRWPTELAEAFIQSGESVGLPRSNDFCREDITGIGYYQTTTLNGKRCSSAAGYLRPARGRPNLQIVTDALCTRIEFEGGAAAAVHYQQGGVARRAEARGEIILSAGSFGTPQLLQLSGVGPGALLQGHGIDVLHEAKGVGQNLIDHISPKRTYDTSSSKTFNAVMNSWVAQGLAGIQYALTRKGPLSVGCVVAGGYAPSRPGLDEPDIQLIFLPLDPGDFSGKLPPQSRFQITLYQSRPNSRGYVEIKSRDPRDAMKIVPRYYSSDLDMQVAVDGLRLVGRIAAAAPLRKLGTAEVAPPPDEGDEALREHVRQTAGTAFHHVGTCRMGSHEDAFAVVDSALRVKGLGKLRIADGSVMPSMISANTNAACIMIGEKCADLLRAA